MGRDKELNDMKVILVNGSPRRDKCTYTALREVEKTLNSLGIDTELIWVGNKPVSGCIDCKACFKNGGTCVLKDTAVVNDFLQKAKEADGFIFGSPVYYASPTGSITSFMDRAFYGKGDVYADKPAAAVVSCRRGGASAAFEQLNKYFGMNNMPVVTSQYWNQVHGNTPEEVMQDAEGLQTMRTLAVNMAWLLKSIEAGRKAGLPAPKREEKTATNFIR